IADQRLIGGVEIAILDREDALRGRARLKHCAITRDPEGAAVAGPPVQADQRGHSEASTDAVSRTVAYSPCMLASDSACTSSAGHRLWRRSVLSVAQVASDTTMVSKPRLPAMRTVASTELCVSTPTITTVLRPSRRSRISRSVPMKALLVRLATTASPSC